MSDPNQIVRVQIRIHTYGVPDEPPFAQIELIANALDLVLTEPPHWSRDYKAVIGHVDMPQPRAIYVIKFLRQLPWTYAKASMYHKRE